MDDFELFKSECLKWIEFFGLKDWELIFEQASLGETRWARVSYDASACTAKFQFNSDPLTSIIHRRHTKKSAFHEVVHLLHARLFHLATCRYVTPSEIEDEEEALVRIMENTVYEKLRKEGFNALSKL